jgi:nucleoside-diphosphate-sugar epimerase
MDFAARTGVDLNAFCKRALVTGATGFIGGRLIEKLILEHGIAVRALVRNFSHAPRIARFDIEFASGSIEDPDAIRRAVEGCDLIFHCAYEFRSTMEDSLRVNLAGTDNLLDQVKRLDCRMVHVSTVDVYGWPSNGVLSEQTEKRPPDHIYGHTKSALEVAIQKSQRGSRLPVTIVQPTIVYGPFAGAWTHMAIDQLKKGKVILVDGGTAICNAVYIDDVIDALILAATRSEAIGESFLISGESPVTWAAFYAAFEKILGIQGTNSMSSEELNEIRRRQDRRPGSLSTLVHLLTDVRTHRYILSVPVLRKVSRQFKAAFPRFSQRVKPKIQKEHAKPLPPPAIPPESVMPLFTTRAIVSIDKAKRMLGYSPAFDFETGMKVTTRYLEWLNGANQ